MTQNIKDVKANCKQWRRNDDGSWTTTQVTDVYYTEGDPRNIRLSTGFSVRKGALLYGVDVIAFLEENCKN
jgi:hypothetical protein